MTLSIAFWKSRYMISTDHLFMELLKNIIKNDQVPAFTTETMLRIIYYNIFFEGFHHILASNCRHNLQSMYVRIIGRLFPEWDSFPFLKIDVTFVRCQSTNSSLQSWYLILFSNSISSFVWTFANFDLIACAQNSTSYDYRAIQNLFGPLNHRRLRW